ncbi:tetratricopeptide repeat protein [Mucilaginibacter paludis]|uniref:Tetratricopeptide TPR_1 repeat-containing protein n=1 Tax=Mucilaginibacter paludis DSM 18603 TaxID=714943 RepID=H1YDG0_9SPHI|nr:tetratricopeptide repeat protein [Mucilaginibacter paludis]EHQ30169.1 Tetratricopeptide TPR_1 repeat-containing protein [Mucilaginibacter paludis DSM 18603]
MKRIVILIVFTLVTQALFAQKEKGDIRKGNQLYQQQKYKEAEESYRNSVAKKDQSVEGNFNLGDALYKQKNYKDAQTQFSKIAASSNDKNVVAKAYHNLGNSLLESKKLEESIDAYKKSLINNPKDDQTRYNLAYAQKMLQKQKDQNKKNKDQNKNQDKNKDQNKDQQNKDQNKKDQDNKDKNDQDKKDQNKDQKDQDKKDQDKKDQQGGQPKMSKEDAERMLEALNNNEKQTQDKLKNKKLKGVKVNISKDW